MGIVQLGRHCIDADLSATLMPTGEQLRLHQESRRTDPAGCRLDIGQLTSAGERIARTLDEGADILIVNRFGRQERKGEGPRPSDRARARRRYSGRDRGAEPPFCGLDQICRRHDRQIALRPEIAGCVVDTCVDPYWQRESTRSSDSLRSYQIGCSFLKAARMIACVLARSN